MASFDGTVIDAWVVSARNLEAGESPRATVLMIHGLWDSKACWFPTSQKPADRGFDVVLADLRAHGHSTGDTTTWGALEKLDLKVVMDTLVNEGTVSAPLYVVGFSMGGGIAVQYAAIDDRCRGVLSVSGVASARRSMRRLLFFWAPWKTPANANDTISRAGEIAGFDVDETSAIKDVDKLECPVFQIHGRLDKTVPIGNGRLVHEAANEPKEFESIWWAPHEGMLPFIHGRVADTVERMHALQANGG